MTAAVYIILATVASLHGYCDAYKDYGSHDRIREKMTHLERELTIDAITKVESVQHLRKKYSKQKEYHIGELVYIIKSKYAQMVRLYFNLMKDQTGGSKSPKKNVQLIYDMLRVQKWSMDINSLADSFEEMVGNDDLMAKINEKEDKEESKDRDKLRRNLEVVDAVLKEVIHDRNAILAKTYPIKKQPQFNMNQELKILNKNSTNLKTNIPKKLVNDDGDYNQNLMLLW